MKEATRNQAIHIIRSVIRITHDLYDYNKDKYTSEDDFHTRYIEPIAVDTLDKIFAIIKREEGINLYER